MPHDDHHYAAIAQLVEHLICNQRVPSSNLGGGTTLPKGYRVLEFPKVQPKKRYGTTVAQPMTNPATLGNAAKYSSQY